MGSHPIPVRAMSWENVRDVELEIAIAYVQLCIEYVQKYYMKRPMCTSILTGRSYVIEVLEGNPQVCYDIFRMDKTIFRHLCNELKRLHLLKEDTTIVSVEEAVATVLFIVGHNADYRLTANRFQHSLETIQRRFRRALRAIHALGCLIIRPDADAAELPHSLRGNEKYYPWFESHELITEVRAIGVVGDGPCHALSSIPRATHTTLLVVAGIPPYMTMASSWEYTIEKTYMRPLGNIGKAYISSHFAYPKSSHLLSCHKNSCNFRTEGHRQYRHALRPTSARRSQQPTEL
ncbi:hypothetical protein CFP56_023351 [Quercus suber]|uniref:DUF8040 domain-containing protein n=1 Tax=Quercus suber TaxID=58331 RepID=A0AAW0KA16_QUESU